MSWGLNQPDIEALKVGDAVGVQVSHGWSAHTTLSKVARRTRTQLTLENGKRFNVRGNEIGGSGYHRAILIAVDEAREAISDERARTASAKAANRLSDYKWKELTYPQLQRVLAVVDAIEAESESSPDAAAVQESATTEVKPEEAQTP